MYEGDIASVLISEEQIRARTAELAEEIAKRYPAGAPEGDL
ncbi:hypoxanthine phosphoribosyltransferase, partial [Rhodococcus erythropolis]